VSVSERAKAIEIPLLRPPHVIISVVFSIKSNFLLNFFTGNIKEMNLANKTITIVIAPMTKYSFGKNNGNQHQSNRIGQLEKA